MKRRMIRPWPGLAGKDRAGRGSLGPARSRSSLGGKSAAGRQAGPADRGPTSWKACPAHWRINPATAHHRPGLQARSRPDEGDGSWAGHLAPV